MSLNWMHIFKLLAACLLLFFICEVLIYYIVMLQCSWPEIEHARIDSKVEDTNEKPVHVMILADTHLLGVRQGHWFDKLRREWQMYRAFQSVMSIHSPELIFFLGDIFDEGLWASDSIFQVYVERFRSMFHHSSSQKSHIAVGNHDIGFHHSITKHLHARFWKEFDAPPVKLVTVRGNHFILINSMAMEGDGCFLCSSAMKRLEKISNDLNCLKMEGQKCPEDIKSYSKPIILQHFPLYRQSDEDCDEPDEDKIFEHFLPKRECLSEDATDFLLKSLKPRAVFGGHSHHSCYIYHKEGVHEWTVASFSWRNKHHPSFLLAIFTSNRFAVTKCYLPDENTVIYMYLFGGISIMLWMIMTRKNLLKRRWMKEK